MPTSQVQLPDGRVVQVEHPEGASDEQIFKFARDNSLSQEEIRSRRLAGVPLDADEAAIMQRQAMGDIGALEGLGIGIGGQVAKVLNNIESLFGADEARARAKEIEKSLQQLGDLSPASAFSEALTVGLTAPLAGGAATGLGARLGGGLAARMAGTGVVGAAEGLGFRDADQSALEAAGTGAALGVAGEGAGELIKRGLARAVGGGRRAAQEALGGAQDTGLREATEEALEATEEAGRLNIGLFPGQALENNVLGKQSLLVAHNVTARRAADALRRQNQEAYSALESVMNDIAPPEAVNRFATRARSTAQLALDRAREARRQITSPLYDRAFDAAQARNQRIDLTDLVNSIERRMDFLTPGEVAHRSLARMARIVRAGGNDLRRIHESRKDLNRLILERRDGGLPSDVRAMLTGYKRQLDNTLEETVPEYLEASRAYRDASAPIQDLEEGVIGRIASYSDEQLQNVSRKLLDPSNVDASQVESARRIFSSVPGGDLAWREVVRGELQRRLGSVRFDPSDLRAENVPQQILSKVFGTEQQSQALYRAAGEDAAANLRFLRRVLLKAAKGRHAGSSTVPNQEILDEMQSAPIRGLRKLLSPKATLEKALGVVGTDENLMQLANRVFEPVVADNLRVIRRALNRENRVPREALERLTTYLSTTAAAQPNGDQ